MSSKKSLHKFFDQKIFNAILKLKNNEQFGQVQDFLNNLNHLTNNYFNYFIFSFFILTPLFFSIFFLISTSRQLETIKIKEEIYQNGKNLTKQISTLNDLIPKEFGANQINSQSDLETLIRNAAIHYQIDQTKIKSYNFNKVNISSHITKSGIIFEVSETTTKKLFNFLESITKREKLMISNIIISKIPNKSLIKANMMISSLNLEKN